MLGEPLLIQSYSDVSRTIAHRPRASIYSVPSGPEQGERERESGMGLITSIIPAAL